MTNKYVEEFYDLAKRILSEDEGPKYCELVVGSYGDDLYLTLHKRAGDGAVDEKLKIRAVDDQLNWSCQDEVSLEDLRADKAKRAIRAAIIEKLG